MAMASSCDRSHTEGNHGHTLKLGEQLSDDGAGGGEAGQLVELIEAAPLAVLGLPFFREEGRVLRQVSRQGGGRYRE